MDRALGLSAFHGDGHDEPWYLVTNYPQIEGRKYGMRMWEELTFRDYKSGGWQRRKSRVWKPERADILWLAMSAAYVWMLSLGAKVCLSPKIQRVAVGRNVNGVNVFRLGLILFHARRLGRVCRGCPARVITPANVPLTVAPPLRVVLGRVAD